MDNLNIGKILAIGMFCLGLGCVDAFSEVQTPDSTSEKLRQEARKFERRNRPAHEEKLLEALSVEGISDKQRRLAVSDLVRNGYMLDNAAAYGKAKALILPILSREDMTNSSSRIAYTIMLSDAAFRSSMPEESKRLLDGLWQLGDLKFNDTNAIFNARVDIDKKMCDYDAARKAYCKVFENPLEHSVRRWDAIRAAVDLWSADRLLDEGIEALDKWDHEKLGHRFDIFSFRCRLMREKGDYDGVRDLSLSLMKEEFSSERDKKNAREAALAELLRNDLERNDLDSAVSNLKEYGEIYKGAVNPLNSIVSSLARLAYTRNDWEKGAFIADLKLDYAFKWGFNWMTRDSFLNYYQALRALGRQAEIPPSTEKIVASDKVGEEDAVLFRIIGARFGKGRLTPKTIRDAAGSAEPKLKLRALANAAKFFVAHGDRETALAIYSFRQALMVDRPQNRAKVKYVKDAPIDVGRWYSSGLMDKLERHDVDVPYDEDEAKKLIYDVSVQRDVSKSGGDSETYFYVCWDDWGVHLLFVGMDSKYREVMEGSLGGTGYEMYLCFGEGAPTYQWIMDDQKNGKIHYYDYASQGKNYRPLKDHVIVYSAPVEGGFATAMNIPWSAGYERLPDNGTTWPFEMIRWSRGGGVTWGGETIWQISRWGRWVFEGMTKERKTAIKRSLLNAARARFSAQSSIRGGEIFMWQDKEIGDPEFYSEALRPFVEKIQNDIAALTPEADARTIDRLYEECMGPMYDFKYYADEIREKYLRKKFTEE